MKSSALRRRFGAPLFAICGCLLAIPSTYACGGETNSATETDASGGVGGAAAQGGTMGAGATGGTFGGGAGMPACTTTMIDSHDVPPCRVDADCPVERPRCREVVPGGYRACVMPDAAPTTLCSHDAFAQCACDGSTCTSGSDCYAVWLGEGNCGTGGGSSNQCLRPCTGQGGCPSGKACMSGGVHGPVAECVPATCRVDADCGGCSRCAPTWFDLGGDCISTFQGMNCTCRSDSDCKPGLTCVAQIAGSIKTRYCSASAP